VDVTLPRDGKTGRKIGGAFNRNGSQTNDVLFECPADDFDCDDPAIKTLFRSGIRIPQGKASTTSLPRFIRAISSMAKRRTRT